MSITIAQKITRNKKVIRYYFEWGKAAGQRISSGIFTYKNPKTNTEKNHNKEALAILESKRAKMILDRQAIGSGYIPAYKIKTNFLDFYSDFVKENARYGSRHLQSSLKQFKLFLKKEFITPIDVTEKLCENYRRYLLDKFNGETPSNYFSEFKKMMKAAKKAGYFIENPAEDLACKSNPNRKKKQILEPEEYIQLLNTPCTNFEVRRAFLLSLYAAFRWCDVKPLKWENIKENCFIVEQSKTKVFVEVPLHHIAKLILGERKTGLVFKLPTADGANKVLKQWVKAAKIEKHITWHCARISFSVLLQDQGVNLATVAGMLGHTSTRMVEQVYQRYRLRVGEQAILKLPGSQISTGTFASMPDSE